MNTESSVSACQLTGKYWVVTSRPCPGLWKSQEVWGQRNPPYQRPSDTDLHGNKSVVLSEASPAIPKTSSRHSHHALPAWALLCRHTLPSALGGSKTPSLWASKGFACAPTVVRAAKHQARRGGCLGASGSRDSPVRPCCLFPSLSSTCSLPW